MPEVNDGNIKDYVRLSVDDYGDSLNNEKEITATIHNLTPEYFTGTVTFSVKDSSGTMPTLLKRRRPKPAKHWLKGYQSSLHNVEVKGKILVIVWSLWTRKFV